MAPVVCSHSPTKETRSTAVQEPSLASAGAQPRVIMTPISSGDSVHLAFCVMMAIQMVTAVIFRSCMAVKCTRRAPLKMKPSPSVPQLTTMMWTSSGAIVEVKKTFCLLCFLNFISMVFLAFSC